MKSIPYQDVLLTLKHTDVVVTPNRRLAAYLQQSYQQLQAARGVTCFESPCILPVNTWIDALWEQSARQQFAAKPITLNSAQEQQLWEKILSDTEYQDYFIKLSETARLVKAARGLLKQWQIETDHPLFQTADDYQALTTWISKFETASVLHGVIDSASLPDKVRDILASGEITPPERLFHAGFTEISPQLAALFSACKTVHALELSTTNRHITRTVANDVDAEIRLCANWAKQQLRLYPTQLTGCVIPNLDKNRDRIAQIFAEVFAEPASFNISAGLPLAKYPVIQAALQLLSLYKKQISAETLFFILSTPFIAGAETERSKRSQFDSRMRRKNFSTITLEKDLPKLAESCPQLAKRIKEFKALLEAYSTDATFAEWAERFNQLLGKLGWPGERVINSEEYQVIEEWLRLLQSLGTLDALSTPVNYHEALGVLLKEAATRTFQPQSPNANVQVLGILEASGLIYDALWICGMDDNSWPAQPKPNPFIPKKLQRELKMPHASAERELEYCQHMTQQFCRSAADIVFSYAKNIDESAREASPLIKHFAEMPADMLVASPLPALSEVIYHSKQIEELVDDLAPAIQATDKVSGGVDIIKNQALCPFKAFAECRLNARELESPMPGLRAKERGTMVHYILQKCWEQLQTSDVLHQYDEAALIQLLDDIIDKALLELAPAQSHQTSYLALEKIRLKKLALEWLRLEKTRPPFQVICNETAASITLNQLSLQVRIDRIDELADGKRLIIDYKTSSALSVNQWLGERPDQPQLPLYALIDRDKTAGIAFAEINAGNKAFKGISQYTLDIDGIKTPETLRQLDDMNWQALTTQWERVLTKLGDDFYSGKAAVDPKDSAACLHCKLQPLCRIHQEGVDDE